jgi:hypothetical protein
MAEPDDVRDATALRVVRDAFLARAEAERDLGDGEAVRQRYGQAVKAE